MSKRGSPLSASEMASGRVFDSITQHASDVKQTPTPEQRPAPFREHLPSDRASRTFRFVIAGHKGYLTVGFYPDGRVGEIFLRMAKAGSTVCGFTDVVATAVSMGLQYGIPLEVFCRKFRGFRFEPSGVVIGDGSIETAGSIVDYVFHFLGKKYCPGMVEDGHENEGELA